MPGRRVHFAVDFLIVTTRVVSYQIWLLTSPASDGLAHRTQGADSSATLQSTSMAPLASEPAANVNVTRSPKLT